MKSVFFAACVSSVVALNATEMCATLPVPADCCDSCMTSVNTTSTKESVMGCLEDSCGPDLGDFSIDSLPNMTDISSLTDVLDTAKDAVTGMLGNVTGGIDSAEGAIDAAKDAAAGVLDDLKNITGIDAITGKASDAIAAECTSADGVARDSVCCAQCKASAKLGIGGTDCLTKCAPSADGSSAASLKLSFVAGLVAIFGLM